MTTIEHLRNAPIIEALVDVRVKTSPDVSVDKLNELGKLISSQYPKKKKLMQVGGQIKVDLKKGNPLEYKDTAPWTEGYIYTSEDDKYVLQVRLNGFTFSRLKPYEAWENLRDEAFRLWELYVKLTSPEDITRVALRYINKLELPLSMGDFNEYLTSPPPVPENLPQKLTSFLTRVVIPEESIGAYAIITQTFRRVAQDIVPVILDIDTFKTIELGRNEKKSWNIVDELHDFKNKVFFASITERTKELYL